MTNEELVEAYQSGDEGALEELLLQNRKFIFKMSKKFFIHMDPAIDEEDLIQHGYIGLIEAAKRYTAGDVGFLSYAGYWVYQCLYRFIFPKKSTLYKFKEGAFDRSLAEKIAEDLELGETICQDPNKHDEIVEDMQRKEDCFTILNIVRCNVSKWAVEILRFRFGLVDGVVYSPEEICLKLGMTKKVYRDLYTKSMNAIKGSVFMQNRRKEVRDQVLERAYDTGTISNRFFEELFKEIG